MAQHEIEAVMVGVAARELHQPGRRDSCTMPMRRRRALEEEEEQELVDLEAGGLPGAVSSNVEPALTSPPNLRSVSFVEPDADDDSPVAAAPKETLAECHARFDRENPGRGAAQPLSAVPPPPPPPAPAMGAGGGLVPVPPPTPSSEWMAKVRRTPLRVALLVLLLVLLLLVLLLLVLLLLVLITLPDGGGRTPSRAVSGASRWRSWRRRWRSTRFTGCSIWT